MLANDTIGTGHRLQVLTDNEDLQLPTLFFKQEKKFLTNLPQFCLLNLFLLLTENSNSAIKSGIILQYNFSAMQKCRFGRIAVSEKISVTGLMIEFITVI